MFWSVAFRLCQLSASATLSDWVQLYNYCLFYSCCPVSVVNSSYSFLWVWSWSYNVSALLQQPGVVTWIYSQSICGSISREYQVAWWCNGDFIVCCSLVDCLSLCLPAHDSNMGSCQNLNFGRSVLYMWLWILMSIYLQGGPKKPDCFLTVCNSRICWHRIAFYISNCSVLYPE